MRLKKDYNAGGWERPQYQLCQCLASQDKLNGKLFPKKCYMILSHMYNLISGGFTTRKPESVKNSLSLAAWETITGDTHIKIESFISILSLGLMDMKRIQ